MWLVDIKGFWAYAMSLSMFRMPAQCVLHTLGGCRLHNEMDEAEMIWRRHACDDPFPVQELS
jgi:hypothetical protein